MGDLQVADDDLQLAGAAPAVPQPLDDASLSEFDQYVKNLRHFVDGTTVRPLSNLTTSIGYFGQFPYNGPDVKCICARHKTICILSSRSKAAKPLAEVKRCGFKCIVDCAQNASWTDRQCKEAAFQCKTECGMKPRALKTS